jgi:hypothetical protein
VALVSLASIRLLRRASHSASCRCTEHLSYNTMCQIRVVAHHSSRPCTCQLLPMCILQSRVGVCPAPASDDPIRSRPRCVVSHSVHVHLCAACACLQCARLSLLLLHALQACTLPTRPTCCISLKDVSVNSAGGAVIDIGSACGCPASSYVSEDITSNRTRWVKAALLCLLHVQIERQRPHSSLLHFQPPSGPGRSSSVRNIHL